MKDEMHKTGYDPEEEFFYRKNKELIDERRASLDTDRSTLSKQSAKEQHWMKCPKCGNDLKELDLKGIKVDRCSGCMGVFFDQGELDLLLEAEHQGGFLSRMKRIISG